MSNQYHSPYEHAARPRAQSAAAVSRQLHKSHGADYTLVHGGRQVRIGPVAFWIVVGTLVVMGVFRKTFLIDREGRIAKIWPKVSVSGHAEEVLEAARAL